MCFNGGSMAELGRFLVMWAYLTSLYLSDTLFVGDAIFDNQKMHPPNPSIVGGASYDASPKRSKGGCRI